MKFSKEVDVDKQAAKFGLKAVGMIWLAFFVATGIVFGFEYLEQRFGAKAVLLGSLPIVVSILTFIIAYNQWRK